MVSWVAGLTPLLSLLLVQWTGDQKAPSMLCGIAGLAAMMEFQKGRVPIPSISPQPIPSSS